MQTFQSEQCLVELHDSFVVKSSLMGHFSVTEIRKSRSKSVSVDFICYHFRNQISIFTLRRGGTWRVCVWNVPQNRKRSFKDGFRPNCMCTKINMLACFKLHVKCRRKSCWETRQVCHGLHKVRIIVFGHNIKFIWFPYSADWKHRVFTNSDWLNALETARTGQSCEAAFQKCALNSENLEQFTKKIRKYAKPKK